jgi:ssDNA-binding replication factor A large subunit
VNLNEEEMKEFIPIILLHAGQKNVTLQGKIMAIWGPKSFRLRYGYVGEVVLLDATGAVRVVLWNTAALELNKQHFQLGNQIRITNAYVRCDKTDPIEVHTTDHSSLMHTVTPTH